MKKEEQIKFIRLLGGVSAVADVCGITRGAVSQWQKNGIPKAQMNFLKVKFPNQYKQISDGIRR
ncbi:Cro/CI family transcriptional regulator [Neisseria polysaccharea]|uniref:Cro/CI family transcriptional regulator n=1 Tax=Neisseria polysaccharea TaxID=489 RepID=UPI00272A66B0|nr:Cro/CI family transcriptional regulator [Neisseria polysaccharea]